MRFLFRLPSENGISALWNGVGRVTPVFFFAAGTLDVPRAWLYYGGTIAYQLIPMVVLFALFPGVIEVVNERGNVNKQGVKT